jgi:hypothetical protein
MSQQLVQSFSIEKNRDSGVGTSSDHMSTVDPTGRPNLLRLWSDPTPSTVIVNAERDEASSEDFYNIVLEATPLSFPSTPQTYCSEPRHSWSTVGDSPPPSRRSSPKPILPSTATSLSIYTLDHSVGASTDTRSRPSVLRRLQKSISASTLTAKTARRPAVHLDDFQQATEQPEKRFIDASGVVIPGVCDRPQCVHPSTHFVSNFRLCEAFEYTTALADHGITYTDYCRLVNILLNFLDAISIETKRYPTWGARGGGCNSRSQKMKLRFQNVSSDESAEMHEKTASQAASLNQLLQGITVHWQSKGIPVMVCVSSFSLFAPHRISEALVQILHVPLTPRTPSEQTRSDSRIGDRLSFIDPLVFMSEDTTTTPWSSMTAVLSNPQSQLANCQPQPKLRDRSLPWPLWPNAIPSGKRKAMYDNAPRYGADPFFRVWIRANINSRTTSNTYAKFMIEQENDPFVTKRLSYHATPSRTALTRTLLTAPSPDRPWSPSSPISVNRTKYEHNRRLECRRTVETGSRLRVLRFGLRYPILPPHNPEMEELGLSHAAYTAITTHFTTLHTQPNTAYPASYLRASWQRLRQRCADDVLARARSYACELNAAQRKIVWTVEKIPDVYEQGAKEEWEISAWNGTCPLGLLMDLERWGIVERRIGEEGEGEE